MSNGTKVRPATLWEHLPPEIGDIVRRDSVLEKRFLKEYAEEGLLHKLVAPDVMISYMQLIAEECEADKGFLANADVACQHARTGGLTEKGWELMESLRARFDAAIKNKEPYKAGDCLDVMLHYYYRGGFLLPISEVLSKMRDFLHAQADPILAPVMKQHTLELVRYLQDGFGNSIAYECPVLGEGVLECIRHVLLDSAPTMLETEISISVTPLAKLPNLALIQCLAGQNTNQTGIEFTDPHTGEKSRLNPLGVLNKEARELCSIDVQFYQHMMDMVKKKYPLPKETSIQPSADGAEVARMRDYIAVWLERPLPEEFLASSKESYDRLRKDTDIVDTEKDECLGHAKRLLENSDNVPVVMGMVDEMKKALLGTQLDDSRKKEGLLARLLTAARFDLGVAIMAKEKMAALAAKEKAEHKNNRKAAAKAIQENPAINAYRALALHALEVNRDAYQRLEKFFERRENLVGHLTYTNAEGVMMPVRGAVILPATRPDGQKVDEAPHCHRMDPYQKWRAGQGSRT